MCRKYAIIIVEVIRLKSILMVRNLKDEESAKQIKLALSETRVNFEVNLEKQCVIVDGDSDMVAVARKVINDLGYIMF